MDFYLIPLILLCCLIAAFCFPGVPKTEIVLFPPFQGFNLLSTSWVQEGFCSAWMGWWLGIWDLSSSSSTFQPSLLFLFAASFSIVRGMWLLSFMAFSGSNYCRSFFSSLASSHLTRSISFRFVMSRTAIERLCIFHNISWCYPLSLLFPFFWSSEIIAVLFLLVGFKINVWL